MTEALITDTALQRKQARKVWNTKLEAYETAIATLEAAIAHDDELRIISAAYPRTYNWETKVWEGEPSPVTEEQHSAALEARDRARREAYEALTAWNISVAEWSIAHRHHLWAKVEAARAAQNWADFYKDRKVAQCAERKAYKAIRTACGSRKGAERDAIYAPLYAKLWPNAERP